MNIHLSLRDVNPFGFDLGPLFNAYTSYVKYAGLPTPNGIIDMYDETVKYMLDDLGFRFYREVFSHYKEPLSSHISDFTTEEIQILNEKLNIKIDLLTNEMRDIMTFYYMFYIDDYGECFNVPVKGVW